MKTPRITWFEGRFAHRVFPGPFSWPRSVVTCLALVQMIGPTLLPAAEVLGVPQVTAGAATFRQNGNVRTIEQHTGAAVINWQDFSIRAGDFTRFIQPGVNSAVLNRVLGANPSLLNGQLQANGSVYLINPNGVVVGPQGRIDVGAFFASTLNLSDDDFLRRGSLTFRGDSKAGLLNLGTINASEGDVLLMAYTVRNAGSIAAPKGVAGVAAASEVLLTPTGDQRLVVRSGVSAEKLANGVENSGVMAAARAELKAAGGLYQLAINQSGMVRATGVTEQNGRVLLTADAGTVRVSGEISARNANGNGGEILVGGDFQGRNAAVPNAATTSVTEGARLDASAAAAGGHGGKVIVWADGATQFKGGITARGGSAGGDGGQVEVSGKRRLSFLGTVDTSAPRGRRGSVLLDPDSIVISNDADAGDLANGFDPFETVRVSRSLPSTINVATLAALLAGSDVTLQTSDYFGQLGGPDPMGFYGISVNADLAWASASRLTLDAGDTIALNANLTAASGSLTLRPGSRSTTSGTAGTVTLAADKSITVSELSLALNPHGADRAFDSSDLGTINLAGTVNARTLQLRRTAGGVQGDVLVNNANNQIGTLEGLGAAGIITGNLRIRNGASGLTVAGDFSDVAGAVEIVTAGNLTLASGAVVKNTGASDLVLASRGGSFINNADASAVDAGGSGRFLIYSDSPANTTKGGLTGANLYGRSFDANAPASITHLGDRFIYGFTPTLTYTADDKSKTYGAANPTLTLTPSGLQSGDALADAATGTPAVTTVATTGTGAGTAAISISAGTVAATDLGYAVAFVAGTLTINPAPLTITADNTSKTYGAANPAFTATLSGLVNGDSAAVVSGLALATTALTSSGAGAYPITGSGASAANYSITQVPGTLTVNKAPLTITADNLSRTYGAANPAFTASYSGLVNGDSSSAVSGLSLSTAATTSSGVGGYAITPAGATAANYDLTLTPGVLTVNPAPLTITANNASRLFGAADPAFTALFSGLVNGDNSSVVSGLSLGTTATTVSPSGTYPISGAGASAANYSISYTPGTLTIADAILTITANNSARTYGAVNPAFTASYAGFTGGDTAAVVSGLQFNTAASVSSSVGTYTLTPFGATAPNYGINYVPGTLTINAADLTIRADNASRTYGAANPTFTATFTGLVAGDTAASISGLSLATAANAASGVGGYTITASGGANGNYNITRQNGTLTVNQAPLTITADNVSKTYGAANPTLTASYSGLVNGENSSVVSGLALNTTAATGSGVGSYPITGSGASAANYSLSYVNGALTVNPAALTITAGNVSKTYGAANPTLTASYSGLVNGDLASVVSGLSLGTTAAAGSGVGGYPITGSGASAANYSLSYAPGTLTVNPAPLTITADSASRTYGAANPAFTASYSGLVNGDLASVVSGLALDTTATAGSGVGGYPITGSGASAANYSLSYAPGTLTINRAPLTITADNQSKTYGSANPTLTASYSGLVNGDLSSVVSGLSLNTTATTSSGVGGYAIAASGASAANYALLQVPGSLTVNPATLTVRADNATRTYGDANPTFTGSVTGFVLGEDASVLASAPSYSTAAGLTTSVGGYAITPSGGSAANYTFTRQNGTLTINPAILAVTADNQVRVYGDPSPTLTYTVTGLKNGDSADGKFFVGTFGSLASPTASVGNYTILLSGLDVPGDNYTTFFGNGTESITARPLTIRTDNVSREYGLPNPNFTATFTGLASFDTPAVIPNLGFTTAATASSGVQTIGVTPTSGNNANYAISRLPGQLTITPAPAFFASPGVLTKVYGTATPTITPAYVSGLRNGDAQASLGVQVDSAILAARNVGSYPVSLTLANPNYQLNYLPGRLDITPAPLTVTIPNQSRKFGEANPAAPVPMVAGLAFSDTAASVLTLDLLPITPQTGVGTYQRGVTVTSPNYYLSGGVANGGLFTILVRNLILKPANVARYYGDANPEFTILVGGEGLAPFHTINDVAFGVTSDADIGVTANAGFRRLNASVGNPNYAIENRPGLLAILPRPVTFTVEDVTRFAPEPVGTVNITVNNLAFFDGRESAFPGLTYRLLSSDVAAPVVTALTPSTVTYSASFTDTLPQTPIASGGSSGPNPVDATGGGSFSTVVRFIPITITLPTDTAAAVTLSEITFSSLSTLSIQGLLTPAEKEQFPDAIRYLQPRRNDANNNYVVTSVRNGKLTLKPNPAVVAAAKESERIAKEKAAIEKLDKNFSTGSSFGLPSSFNSQIRGLIINALLEEIANNKLDLRRALFGDDWNKITDLGSMTDERTARALGDFHTNPTKQAAVMPLLFGYINKLAAPGVIPSAEQQKLLDYVAPFVAKVRDSVIDVAIQKKAEYDAGLKKKAEQTGVPLTTLFGSEAVPYGEFISAATGKVVEERMGGIIAGSVVGGVAGAGIAAAVSASVSVIMPFAASAAAGAGGTAVIAASTVAAPAIVAVAVAAIIVRGVQVGKEEKAKSSYDDLISAKGKSVDMKGYASSDNNKAWLAAGLLEMMSGGSGGISLK